MWKLLLVLMLLLVNNDASTQPLINDGALEISRRLRETHVLSEKGKAALRNQIQGLGKMKRGLAADEFGNVWKLMPLLRELPDEAQREYLKSSRLAILIFLQHAFATEFSFRSGGLESYALMLRIQAASKRRKTDPLSLQTEFNAALSKAWPAFRGPQIESAIPIEDVLPVDRHYTSWGFGSGAAIDTGLIDETRSAVGRHRSRTLGDLLALGLVDSNDATSLREGIRNNTIATEGELLQAAFDLGMARASYGVNIRAERTLAANLRHAGMLSGSAYERLLNSYQPQELKGKRGLLRVSERAVLFETKVLPSEPQAFYDTVFATIRDKLLPGFRFRSLQVQLFTDTANRRGSAITERTLEARFELSGMTYSQQIFYDFGRGHNSASVNPLINRDMLQAVNNWLSDTRSAQRLFFVTLPDSIRSSGTREFGIALMTQEQLSAWGKMDDDQVSRNNHKILFSIESFDRTFSPTNLDLYLRLYDSIGLFAHLTPDEKTAGRATAMSSKINSYAGLMAAFPRTVVVFDMETGNLKNPYEELTRLFAAASRGAFSPTHIRDDFARNLGKRNTTKFSFDAAGRHYEASLQVGGDWLDPAFLELLQQAVRDAGTDGDWYYCMENGQESGYVFLNKYQHEILKLRQPGLFPSTAH